MLAGILIVFFTNLSSIVLVLLEQSNCFRHLLDVLDPEIQMALLCLLLVILCSNKMLFFLMLKCKFYKKSNVSSVLLLTFVVDSSS